MHVVYFLPVALGGKRGAAHPPHIHANSLGDSMNIQQNASHTACEQLGF